MTVGDRIKPVGWSERTSGQERYIADLPVGNALVCRILRSPVPHGYITRLDTRPALDVPGVVSVITIDDFPKGVKYIHVGEEFADRTPLADGVVRYVGEEIAAVAAESEAAAEAALSRIDLRIRRVRAPLTPEDALAPRAPTLHRRPKPNLPVDVSTQLGVEVDPAELVCNVEGFYTYPAVAHASMEPHAVLAFWHPESQRLEVWASTQSPYYVEKEVANALGLDRAQVVCREVAVGGGFGVKSKIAEHEAIAGMLAIKSGRPVRCVLDRSEEFGATKTRHATRTHIRLSSDATGTLRQVEADVLMDNGAYNHYGPTVLGAALGHLAAMYRPSVVRYRGRLVDTSKPPGGPFRGYGTTQSAFALESAVDELAEASGTDPIDFRIANANRPNTVTLSGARIGTCALVDCLQSVREAIRWDDRRQNPTPWRGVGVAAATHGSGTYAFPGSDRSESVVELRSDGTPTVRFGSADAGTGQRTILAQIAATALGVAAAEIEVVSMDGDETPADMGSWSSRGTHFTGHATRIAAEQLAEHLRGLAQEKFGGGSVTLRDGAAHAESGEHVSLGDLVPLSPIVRDGAVSVPATYVDDHVDPLGPGPRNRSASYAFAAHAAEVEVDPRTGVVSILRYVAAHDVGQPINPTLVEGQIRGGVVMGLGAALGEELMHEGGRVVNTAYVDYPLPRSEDVCDIEVRLVGEPDPNGPHGAKSVGEIPLHPVAPAVANAVYAATGIRIRELPITPDKILSALADRDGRGRRFRIWRRPGRWWISFIRWLYPRGLHWVLHRWGTRLGQDPAVTQVVETVDVPADLPDALSAVEGGATPFGGGTDLLARQDQGFSVASHIVPLGGLEDLTRIERLSDGSLSIGGAVTLATLEQELKEVLPAVAAAVATIASTQIRAAATLAGNLLQDKRCWFYRNGFSCYKRSGPTCPCYAVMGDHRFHHAVVGAHRCQAVTPSDLATVLIALDGEVELRSSSGYRRVSVEDLYTGPGETQIRPGELLVSATVPEASLRRKQAFRKLALWSGDFATAAVAISYLSDRGIARDPRVVLGAAAPAPWRARRTEGAVDGTRLEIGRLRSILNDELDHAAHPLRSNAWKLDALVGLAEQAAEELIADVQELVEPGSEHAADPPQHLG